MKLQTLAFTLLFTGALFATEKPNVIFLLCDDLGYADVGYMQKHRATRSVKIQTPNIDRLAAEGTILTDHYCASPVCAPSRASIMTGKLQRECSLRNNQFDKPIQESRTLGTVMREAGYETYAIGKWGIGGGGEARNVAGERFKERTAHPLAKGFDHYYGFLDHMAGHTYYHYDGLIHGKYAGIYESMDGRTRGASGRPADYDSPAFATTTPITYPDALGDLYWNATKTAEGRYSTDVFIARAKKYIEDQLADGDRRDKPFFMYLAINTIHGSGQGAQNPTLPDGQKQNLHVPGFTYTNSTDSVTGQVTWPLPIEPAGIRNTYHDPAYAGLNDSAQRYATAITRLDQAVGDLVAYLKEKRIYDNTIIVFTSDNGPAAEYGADPASFESNGPFFGFKRDVYEGGMRVPAFVTWPKHAAQMARTNDAPSISADWLEALARVANKPTLANAPIPVSKELSSIYVFGGPGQDGTFDGLPSATRYVHGWQRWKREGSTVTLQAGGRDKPVVVFEDINGKLAPDEATRRQRIHQDVATAYARLPNVRYTFNGSFDDTGLSATFGVPSPLTAIGPEMGSFVSAVDAKGVTRPMLKVANGAIGDDPNTALVAAEYTLRDSGSVASSLGDGKPNAPFAVRLQAKIAPLTCGKATLFTFGAAGKVSGLAADARQNRLWCYVNGEPRAEVVIPDMASRVHTYALVGNGRELRVLVDGQTIATLSGVYPDTTQTAYGLAAPSTPCDDLTPAVGSLFADFELDQSM